MILTTIQCTPLLALSDILDKGGILQRKKLDGKLVKGQRNGLHTFHALIGII